MPAKATDRWGIAFAAGPTAKGFARSVPSLRSIGFYVAALAHNGWGGSEDNT